MTTKRRDTEIRRKQIAEAARELIVKYGSEHITIRRIADAVGISEAAIYRHFRSKRDILSLLIDNMDETLLNDITQAKEQKGSSLQSLNYVISHHISAIEQRRGIYFQVLAEIISLGDKKLNKEAAIVIDTYIKRLAGLISEGVESGELKNDINPQSVAVLLFGMIQGLTNLWAIHNYKFDLVDRYHPLWGTFQHFIINNQAATPNN